MSLKALPFHPSMYTPIIWHECSNCRVRATLSGIGNVGKGIWQFCIHILLWEQFRTFQSVLELELYLFLWRMISLLVFLILCALDTTLMMKCFPLFPFLFPFSCPPPFKNTPNCLVSLSYLTYLTMSFLPLVGHRKLSLIPSCGWHNCWKMNLTWQNTCIRRGRRERRAKKGLRARKENRVLRD